MATPTYTDNSPAQLVYLVDPSLKIINTILAKFQNSHNVWKDIHYVLWIAAEIYTNKTCTYYMQRDRTWEFSWKDVNPHLWKSTPTTSININLTLWAKTLPNRKEKKTNSRFSKISVIPEQSASSSILKRLNSWSSFRRCLST